jgi:hypothetical protein
MKRGSVRDLFARVPPLVTVGACCGVVAGASIGMMAGPMIGIVFGVSLGASAGILAGIVMDNEDKRSSLRTRKLDDIIGITGGSLGRPSRPPPLPWEREREHEVQHARERELNSWLSEWMTPPAPQVR